jgi:acetamidase/formamidase
MGDGELSSRAIDICAEVRVRIEVLEKKYDIMRPVIENEKEIIATSNAPEFHESKKIVVRQICMTKSRWPDMGFFAGGARDSLLLAHMGVTIS